MDKYGVRLVWIGMSGMKWEDLQSNIRGLLRFYGIPAAILIHCGGNDIGNHNTPCGYLLYQMKVTFASIMIELLPGCPIIWSSILPRLSWRYSNNTSRMERTRKRINRHVRSFLLKRNCYIIKHTDFDDKLPALFADDGVHLSFIGYDIFINTLQGALETFFSYPDVHIYPYC